MLVSISELDFGTVITDHLSVIEYGGGVRKAMVKRADVQPFYHSDGSESAGHNLTVLRGAVTRSVGLDDRPTLQQVVTLMHLSIIGIVEVFVRGLQDV